MQLGTMQLQLDLFFCEAPAVAVEELALLSQTNVYTFMLASRNLQWEELFRGPRWPMGVWRQNRRRNGVWGQAFSA